MSIDLPTNAACAYSGATRVIFIVGDPVAQVKAPYGLTPVLRERGADTIVVPAHVTAADFAAFVAAVERMGNADGLIITVPHKFAAHDLCASVDDRAARLGSVNLMRRHPQGGWFGVMTDGDACVMGLRDKGFPPAGKRVLLVGAGGAGIAVADALVRAGVAALGVHEIDPQRRQNLIERVSASQRGAVFPAPADPAGFDLVVNATLLGTAPEDPLPVPVDGLAASAAVADLACGPGGCSALIRAAAARGCVTMSGDEMFGSVCGVLADFFLESAASATGRDAAHQSSTKVPGASPDAASQLRQLLNGYQATQAIHAAAMLGVADHLSDTPVSIERLAAAVGADPTALYRLLRALAALNVFEEHANRGFSLAPMGLCLRSDADPSVRPWAMFIAEPSRWSTWGHLLHSVRTGENAFKAVHGMDSWQYRRTHPEQAALFQAAMTANSQRVDGAVVAACDLRGRSHVGDIGGGHGSLLAAVLRDHPNLQGTLFDQPHVASEARPLLNAAGVLDRCRVVGGDMFAGVPTGCDALIMKFILHDWEDREAEAILRSCRTAVAHGAALFIVEYLLEPPNRGLYAKMSDLNMLLGPGGRERTESEYAALLGTAGFSLRRVVPTGALVSVMEAEAC